MHVILKDANGVARSECLEADKVRRQFDVKWWVLNYRA